MAGDGGDDDFVDFRIIRVVDRLIDSGARDWNHHYAHGGLCERRIWLLVSNGVQDDQVFESQIAFEAQGAGAESSNGSCRYFQHVNATLIDAHLCVYRAVA